MPRIIARLAAGVLLATSLCGATCRPLFPPGAGEAPAPLGEGPKVLAELTYWELVTGGAAPGAKLPVVVGLHGRGGSPAMMSRLLAGLRTPARVLAVQGLEPYHRGYWWFEIPDEVPGTHPPGPFGADYEQAVRKLGRFLTTLHERRGTRPVVVGFSQGALLAWALAVRFPDEVCGAVPASGFLPVQDYPGAAAPPEHPVPPIRALHGADDPVVHPRWDRQGAERLEELGADVTLQEFAGVGHRVDPEERRVLYAHVSELAARCAPAP